MTPMTIVLAIILVLLIIAATATVLVFRGWTPGLSYTPAPVTHHTRAAYHYVMTRPRAVHHRGTGRVHSLRRRLRTVYRLDLNLNRRRP